MKWLLLLFLGITVVPVLALNTPINQTEYQKLETDINTLKEQHANSDSYAQGYAIITFVAGGLVALFLFVIQFKQGDKIGKMTKEIEKFVQVQNKISGDIKNAYASAFVGWVHFINFNFEFIIKLYKEYIAETDFTFKESIRKLITERYDRDLINNFPKIDIKEILKIFGKEISDTVWKCQTHLPAEWWKPSDNKSMTTLVNEYVKQMKKVVALKDIFLQYCDQQIKEQDEGDKEIYDKINSTEAFRV